MVRFTAPKRTSKNVTIEEYNAEKERRKEKFRRNTGPAPVTRYVNLDRRFRYTKQTQKLKQIDVNVAHYINEIRTLPYSHDIDSIGSFFYDELENAKFQDLTPEFQEFYAEVLDISQNLALILYNLERIVNIMLQYLDKKDCRKTILQIFPGLFRDTQKDIFKLFIKKILPKLIEILKSKDLDILGDLFKCLAYALRFLYDEIKVNFQEFYSLYIEKFFSSRNVHIQRFTTESLSFVIRKLKGSEIESYITIVMNPLLTVQDEQEAALLVEHIAKLLFYSIKNPQETYTSKSLVVVENMLKFVLKNKLEDPVRECMLAFIHEILTHSRPREDTFKDEFQEKINISKSNLFEHFIKVFLQWLGSTTDVAEHASKIQLICEIFNEMLVYRKGAIVNQALFKIIFTVVKELETIYSAEMLDEETKDIIKRADFIVIAKLLKYKEADLLKEKEYVQFIDEKVRRGSHNNELINLFFEKITEEIEANIPNGEYMSQGDFLTENYTLKKYSYDILLNLILQSFSWDQIVHPDGSEQSSVQLLNLYFFYIIHKYSNRKNKVILQHDKYRITEETHQRVLKLAEQLLIPLLEASAFKDTISPQYTQNYTRLLLFVKYLEVFEVLPEDRQALDATLASLNEKFQQKLKEKANSQGTEDYASIDTQNLYKLPDSLRKQFEYYGLKKGQEYFNLRELLLILKGEIIAKIGSSVGGNYKNKLEQLDNVIQREFQFLLSHSNRNNIYYLKKFSDFLEEILDTLNATPGLHKQPLGPALAISRGAIRLSLEKYGKYIEELTSNLSNPASDVRRYTLEIITRIQVYDFPQADANVETTIVGECDALNLCLEIESAEVSIETERIKTMNFNTLRTYTDFKRIPVAYQLPLLNYYIGSLYVRLTSLWEHVKGNITSLMKLNSKKLYPELRKHILYFNNLLNPRVEPIASFDRTIEATSFNVQQEQERTKYLLDMFFEDHFVKMEHVHQEDVFKNLFEAMSKHSKVIEFNNEDFYSIFSNFLYQEYYKTFENESVPIDIQKLQVEAKKVEKSEENLLASCYKEALQSNKEKDNLFKKCRHFGNLKLESFLKVFISFQKIKSLQDKDTFYQILMSFLRKGHVTIQKNALDCLIKFEKEEIVQYADDIRKFIKPESYREQMIQFKLDKETGLLTEDQRKIVVPIIIGSLFPKLFEQKGRDRKSHMESNRTMVFIFFSNLEEEEVHYLISILFRNYGLPWENIENVSLEALMVHMSKLSLEKVSAFLETLKNLIDQLGVILCPYLPNISKLVNAAVKLTTIMRKKYTGVVKSLKARASQEGVELTEEEEVLVRLIGKWKNVYQAALKRVAQIYTKYSGWDFGNQITESLMDTLKENILNLYIDSSSNISLLLKVLVVWSKHRVYLDYFLQFKEIFPSVVKIYAQTKAKAEVLTVVDQILSSICGFAHFSKNMDVEDEGDQNNEIQETKEEGAKKAQKILSDNVNYTISCIKVYFEYQMGLSKHKVWRPSLRMTNILVSLSEHVQESTLCNDLLGLLQPLIDAQYINKAYDKRKRRDNTHSHVADKTVETLVGVLKTFVNFFKHSTEQERFYQNILNLLSELYVEAPRKTIVEMVLSLQQEKFNLSTKAIVYIEVLNKYNRLSHRELDYGAVSSACIDINQEYLAKCSFEDQQLLLTQYFFLLTQDELSLRMSAIAGFKQFFELINEKIGGKKKVGVQKEINFILSSLVPKAVKGLKGSDENQVKGNLELLDMYVNYMNEYKKKGLNLDEFDSVYYLDLKILQNKTDQPQDFFENIFDVQNYKRVKAITILTKKLTAMNNKEENAADKQPEEISMTSLRNIILPVLRFQILDKSLQENVLKNGGSQVTHAKTLVTNMIEAYSMCLKNFSWSQYFNILKTNITTLNKSAKYEKVMVRLICANLNYLDAGLPNIVEEVVKEMKNQENNVNTDGLMNKLVNYDPAKVMEADDFDDEKDPKKVMGKLGKQQKKPTEGGMEVEEAAPETKKAGTMEVEAPKLTEEEEKKATEEKNKRLTQLLRKKILVPLRKHMHDLAAQDNKEKKIRVYTAIAIAKLVCRFPFNMFNIEFPRLLHNICESLKSRDFDIRNNARKALTEIALITGPYFFHYIVNEMNSVLALGYQQHVKNYTLYYLIQSMIHPKNEQTAQKVEIGSFDYCLNSILPVFADEILGKLHEEKEVEEIKQKIPEFRTSKAFESFNLLASVIDVKKTFVYFVNFIRTQLQENSNMQKKCNKIEEILRQFTEGVTKNPSLDVELILIICFYLIEQSLDTMMIKDTPDLNEFTVQEYSLTKDDLKKYDVQRTFLIQEGAASGKSIFKLMQANQKKNVFMVGRIMASFSINLILMCIKKSFIKPGNKEDPQQQSILSKFEPLTKLIINCIKSNENNVITGSIKILNKIATWPLNSLQKNYKKIVSSALTVLESLSMTDYEMIRVCFKLIGNVFHIPTAIQLANNQIKALLQYIDQFMFVSDHIGDVIDCLNTMMSKKVVRPEVYDLMDKIIENMITSNSAILQKSCKNAFLTFLVEYPMSEKLIKKYIQIFIKNLDYTTEQGRGVAIDVLARIVEALPVELLHNYFDLILYTCILKSISEEDHDLKTNLRKVGQNLLRRVPQEKTPEYIQNFLSWLGDSKEGVVQAGLEGFLLLILQGARVEKHFKVVLEKLEAGLNQTVYRIEQYWLSQREEHKREKQKSRIQSKFLKKLKEENEEDIKIPIEENESLAETLLRLIQTFAEKQPAVLTKYINNENKEFMRVFLSLVTFPKEKFVVDCLGVIQTLLENIGGNLKPIFPDAANVMENIAYKLIGLFKHSFATNDFEKGATETVLKSYALVSEQEKDAYTVLILNKLLKTLLKMMGSANLNALRIKRIITFVDTLEKSSKVQKVLTGNVLKSFVDIVVRIENIKDMFVGENDISQLVTELLDNINKRAETNEFIKVYSGSKVKLQELKEERKMKAKEEVILNPESALKEKLRRKLKKKEARKGVFGAAGKKFKKLKIQQ